MKYENTVFPSQKIPLKQKNDSWREACVDYIVGMSETIPSGSDITSYEEMQTYYDLYNSIFNEKDLKYVTDPFKQDDGFPASPQNFNIIRPKIDLLLGEEAKMPFIFKVIRTSSSAVSSAQEEMKQMLMQYAMMEIMSGMSEEDAMMFQQQLESGEIMPPEKLAQFMTRDYKDIVESSAYHALNYLKEKLGIQHQFNKGFKDALIAGKEVYYIGIQNGEPFMEAVNPMYIGHDQSPDVEFIEDGDWACRRLRLSATEIYDRLNDKMSEADLTKLLEYSGQDIKSGKYGKDGPMIDYNHLNLRTVSSSADMPNTSGLLNVWHATWKSYKKVGFVTFIDENEQINQVVVSEDYLKTGEELAIEWKWIIEVWEGYKVGEDMYIGIGPLEYQHMSMDNLNSQKLPYTGTIYSNSNSKSRSLVSIMKPLQYMYIIIWYRLELALARDKGKVITMDITQIPKSMNIDASKWMHYLSALGVNFVNPYEEGWDIPGREGGKPAQFNQISAIDLTMANVIDQYINLMAKIEEMIGEISGITKQRQGAVSNRELVGSVERAVVQSSLITEPLFWQHNQCKKNVLRMLLNTAKEAWRASGRTHLQYIYDDNARNFLTLSDNFFYEDMDVFVTDSSKAHTDLEMIKSLYQPAMQNGASLLDIAEIVTLDNVSEIKVKLKEIEKKNMEMQQQMQQAEQEAQERLIQLETEAKQQEYAIREQELMLDKYKIDADNQTRIVVAEINAYRFQSDLDADGSGIPDPMEIADAALKEGKLAADIEDKRMGNMRAEREALSRNRVENEKLKTQRESDKNKLKIEEKKISLEKEKMKHEKALQKMKDAAAMERERIKSKTALKNKVTGEK